MKSTQVFTVMLLACMCAQLCAAAAAGASRAEGGAAGRQPAAAVVSREDGKGSFAGALASAREGVVLGAAQSSRSG